MPLSGDITCGAFQLRFPFSSPASASISSSCSAATPSRSSRLRSGDWRTSAFARAVYDIGRLAGSWAGRSRAARGFSRRAEARGRRRLRAASRRPISSRIARASIDHELLDAAALLAVCSTVVVAMPALLEATPQLLAPHRPALWLAGLAATLSMIERVAESEDFMRVAVPSPIVALPPRRGRVSALRWDYLRREARGLLDCAPKPSCPCRSSAITSAASLNA